MHSNRITTLIAIGALAVAAMAPAAIAEGSDRPQVDYTGTGTYEMVEFGLFARGAAVVHGSPFDGEATFMLRTDDGTLPQAGECEPGGANFAVTGAKRKQLWGVSTGEVCGQWLQAPNTVTHVFTGQYSIAESRPRLTDTEGWIEIRLATDNRAAISLFDS
jgi:hypothetical protein